MVLCVHGPCTETVRALAGFKLSARGVQTQHTRSSNSARGATTRRPLSTQPPMPPASPARLTIPPPSPPSPLPVAGRWSPSPHACLTRSPHHHATHAALAGPPRRPPGSHARSPCTPPPSPSPLPVAGRRSPSPHACLARSPHHHATHAALAGRPRPTPASPARLTITPPSSPSPVHVSGFRLPSPHASLARSPHHHAALVAFAL